MTDSWPFFAADLARLLGDEDDPAFWQAALDRILAETDEAAAGYCGREAILLRVGRCSHWIRPHWKRPSGMAYPFGYAPGSY